MPDFDAIVIGAGSAGYAAARSLGEAGLATAVIEGGPQVGGLCILRGCMPTKALLYAAEVLHLTRMARTWGLDAAAISFDFEAVMQRKDNLIREFADYREQQLKQGQFKFFRAHAFFEDPHTIRLSDDSRLTAGSFVLCTGSRVAPPPIPELRGVRYLTSDEALTLKRPPQSLIILGGGSVAVEFAQFFARFGVKVTLIQRSSHLLRDFEVEAAAVLENVFRREGVDLYTDTHLTDAWTTSAGKKGVSFDYAGRPQRVEADELLFALGRVPLTEGLGLEHAGVSLNGFRIDTNNRMQTSAPHIYAAGDCTSPFEIVHVAIQQAELAAHNIARPGSPREIDYRLVPSIVFTEPQLAQVGLNEKEAQRAGTPFLAASYPFADHGKSMIMEAKDGYVRLLADPQSGEILGASCVGPLAGELIHEMVVAMAAHLTVGALAAIPHYHPTLAEIWTYPADELAGKIKNQRSGE
jgi:pyruvate/2-oxoglutarate dehydrogenase complex dihydrolipoamide dehydrogenase (E3) component